MIEQWKPSTRASKYLMSSFGRMKNTETGRLRKLYICPRGYAYVGFWAGGKLRNATIHKLVMEAFVGPCPDGFQVCHNDGNPSNNRLENLRYGTPKDNGQDKINHGRSLRGELNGNSKLPDTAAQEIFSLYETGNVTQYELARCFGISQSQVNNIVLGRQRGRAA